MAGFKAVIDDFQYELGDIFLCVVESFVFFDFFIIIRVFVVGAEGEKGFIYAEMTSRR
jgi:hypothetical protein